MTFVCQEGINGGFYELPSLETMKLFTADIQKKWDRQTVLVKDQKSLDLMELAAECCAQAILESPYFGHYQVVCGIGNNGGDGLALACLLKEAGMVAEVLIVGSADNGTPEFKANLHRVMSTDIPVAFFNPGSELRCFHETVWVDCLFGVGVNRPVVGLEAEVIDKINQSGRPIVSVDVPSGLFCDSMTPQVGPVIQASLTLALHTPKRAFHFQENQKFVGRLQILDLLLDDAFQAQHPCDILHYSWLEAIETYKPRNCHANKNHLGHGLIIGGSRGKMGAALLSAEACMRSGAGLCTTHIPSHGQLMVQINLPEAMLSLDADEHHITSYPELAKYDAIGIGPGLGTQAQTLEMVRQLSRQSALPMVWDADGINLLAVDEGWKKLPPMSILTPHDREFDRLFGIHKSSFDRVATLRSIAREHQLVIALKGHYTTIACPDGLLTFNGSGYKGLATAGSGDVLTGIITGLLCQGYNPADAARLGVFLHGEAGHYAGFELSVETMLASDIISHLSKPFSQLNEAKI
jgi:ADP-dependent NAD(P)H-hydrate dehydratase / NAD(P)H-hydrate epimerase